MDEIIINNANQINIYRDFVKREKKNKL